MVPLFRILILAPLAYVIACIAAGYLVAFALFGLAEEPVRASLIVWSGIPLTFYAGLLSFVPALAAIVLAEIFGWRSIFFWLAVGGLIGLIGNGLTTFSTPPGRDDYALALHLAAGFAGGAIYWLFAGQWAGIGWSPPPTGQSAPESPDEPAAAFKPRPENSADRQPPAPPD